MSRILSLMMGILLLLGMVTAYAQNRQLLYDFYEIPQALLLNPGVKSFQQWHAGIPMASSLSLQAGSSGITVQDLFANDGLDFTTKFRDRVINGLSQNDEFSGSMMVELLGGGFRSGNNEADYVSFGIYTEGFLSQFWPRDPAILAFEGNANNLNRRFNLNHLASQGELVTVFHFGINRKINQKWTVGARAKLYSSMVSFKSTNNEGYFVTTVGQNNLLRNTFVADLRLRTSGIDELVDVLSSDTASNREAARLLQKRALLGGDLGIGMDFGFTHQWNRQTFITGSILDVGFIRHKKDVQNYTLRGAVTNEGIEIALPRDILNLTSNIWEELVDDIAARVPLETDEDSYIAMRPLKLYTSIRHNFGERVLIGESCDCDVPSDTPEGRFDYLNSVGGQLFAMHRPRGLQTALTAFYQRRFGNVLALKATYTIDKYSPTNLGMGMNLQLGKFNFYVLADNLLGFRNIANSHYQSFQLGFNIISWNGN